MATNERLPLTPSPGLLNVRPFMGQIRRKARQVVMHNELEELRRALEGKNLERVELIQSLVRDV